MMTDDWKVGDVVIDNYDNLWQLTPVITFDGRYLWATFDSEDYLTTEKLTDEYGPITQVKIVTVNDVDIDGHATEQLDELKGLLTQALLNKNVADHQRYGPTPTFVGTEWADVVLRVLREYEQERRVADTEWRSWLHPDRWKWLESTRELQRVAYDDENYPKQGVALAESMKMNALAAMVEIGEAMGEVGWKDWASERGWINREAFIVEMVDAGHFQANMLIAAGVTDDEYNGAYRRKQALNLKRQQDGYTGRNKCPACQRAYDDPAVNCHPANDIATTWCMTSGYLNADDAPF